MDAEPHQEYGQGKGSNNTDSGAVNVIVEAERNSIEKAKMTVATPLQYYCNTTFTNPSSTKM